MMPKCIMGLFVLIAILTTGRLVFAQELTAEQVGHDTTGHTFKSKVYMGHGKVRIEPLEGATPDSGASDKSIILLDLAAGTSTVLDTDRKIYVEQAPAIARRSVASFRTADNTPCEKNPNSTGTATCKQIGTETINGRNAEKWELVLTMGGQTVTGHVWLDAQWHFIVKEALGMGMTGELQNIKEGPQPASLFEVPADYHQATMQDRFRNNSPH
jgi:hypothetical protein